MTKRSLYLNTIGFWRLFKCLNLTLLPVCFKWFHGSKVRPKHLKRHQKPTAFKYRLPFVIYFTHWFLYMYIYIYIYYIYVIYIIYTHFCRNSALCVSWFTSNQFRFIHICIYVVHIQIYKCIYIRVSYI